MCAEAERVHLNQCTKRFTKFCESQRTDGAPEKRGKREKEIRGGSSKGSLFFFLLPVPECEQYVWIRIDRHDSEIAPFYCTSVYFESVSLAFLHLTWWLHHFPPGRRMYKWVGALNRISLCTQAATGKGLSPHRSSVVLSDLTISIPAKTFRLCTLQHNHRNHRNYHMEASYFSDRPLFCVGFFKTAWKEWKLQLHLLLRSRFCPLLAE